MLKLVQTINTDPHGKKMVRAGTAINPTVHLNMLKNFLPNMLFDLVNQSIGDNNKSITMVPLSKFLLGVCLIVDISGFTRLSGQYCSRGKDGIDELQRSTNAFIGQLVELVHFYGGDVIKFAGDAIICVFSDSQKEWVIDENVANNQAADELSRFVNTEHPHNALHCALELALLETGSLTVHVALSFGEICFSVMGGHNDQFECLIGGGCIAQISQCLNDASSKQVVGTPEFIELLNPTTLELVTLETLHSGNVLLTDLGKSTKSTHTERQQLIQQRNAQLAFEINDAAQTVAHIVKFCPQPILQSGHSDIANLAELREVTTMFMNWESYDSVQHRDLTSLQPLFYQVQEILAKKGAFIRQFLVDDKGCVLIACWGPPTASYVDNALRAVNTAMLLRSVLYAAQFKSSYGVTTGNGYCGTVGSVQRREYSVIGDVVNMAARLMAKAKGGIMIDEATFNRIPSSIAESLQKLPLMVLKGKAEPQQVYAFSSMDGSVIEQDQRTDGNLLDYLIRSYHIQALMKVVNAVAPLGGAITRNISHTMTKLFSYSTPTDQFISVVYIEGKIGTGTSSLLTWFGRELSHRDVRTVMVNLTKHDLSLNYRTLLLLFQALMGHGALDREEDQQKAVAQLLDSLHGNDETADDARQTLAVMKLVLGITVDVPIRNRSSSGTSAKASSRWKKIKGNFMRISEEKISSTIWKIFEYLINYTKTVVLLGRVHYADEHSLAIIQTFHTFPAKSMIVVSTVPQEDVVRTSGKHPKQPQARIMQKFREEFESTNCTFISVKFYTMMDIEAILCTALNLRTAPIQLAEMVHKLSGGSAFWVKEIVEFIRKTGADEFITLMQHDSDSATATPTHKENISASRDDPESARLDRLNAPRSHHNLVDADISKAKLDAFVICRLEICLADEKRVLKVASVVGYEFSVDILQGVIPEHLQRHLQPSLEALIRNNWLKVSDEDEKVLRFTHEFIYSTLLELIPLGERVELSATIADFVEKTYPGDHLYYEKLSTYFKMSNNIHKSLQYTASAVLHYMQYDDGNHAMDGPRCVQLLSDATTLVETVTDIDVITEMLTATAKIMHENARSKLERHEDILSGREEIKESSGPNWQGVFKKLNCFSHVKVGDGADDEDDEHTAFGAKSKSVISERALANFDKAVEELIKDLDTIRDSIDTTDVKAYTSRDWQLHISDDIDYILNKPTAELSKGKSSLQGILGISKNSLTSTNSGQSKKRTGKQSKMKSMVKVRKAK